MLVQALCGQSSASPVACKLHQQMHASWAHLAVPRMHLANTQAHLLLNAHFKCYLCCAAGKGSPKLPACPLRRVYEGHACWQPQKQMLEQT